MSLRDATLENVVTMFLDDDELEALTGYKLQSCQAKWLKDNGYPFELSAIRRKPRVLRAYVEQRLGLAGKSPKMQTEPDFSHWKAA